jgi:hypothetical protein
MHKPPPRGTGLEGHGPPLAAGHPSGLDRADGIKWDGTDVVITLRVPLTVANCKRVEHRVDNYFLLKTKMRVAA